MTLKLRADLTKSKSYPTGFHVVGMAFTVAENGHEVPARVACASCMCPISVEEECHGWLPTGTKEGIAYCAECCASELEEILSVLE